MKILLVVPTHQYQRYPSPLSASDFPTAFGYLASSLKEAGHDVYGLNLNNIFGYATGFHMVQDHLTRKIKGVEPDLIATGGLCIDFHCLRDIINITRNVCKAPIVLGGGIINNDYEYIFNLLKPDFCVIGDGEETLVKLCNSLPDVSGINNIGYWEES